MSQQLSYTLCVAADYKSGNVRQRHKAACAATACDPSYAKERDALAECMPADIPISDIEIRLGAAWIDPGIVQEFIADTLCISTKMLYTPEVAAWSLEAYSAEDTLENTHTYGISYETWEKGAKKPTFKNIRGLELVTLALNLKQPTINLRKAPDLPKEYSMVLTTQAVGKQEALNDRFAEWCRADADLAHNLETTYNERFNSLKIRDWKGAGSYLTLDGMSEVWRNKIKARPYQLDGIAMGIVQGGGIFFDVGLGKTVVGLAIAYERRRIGNCNAPWIVVKKQTLPDYCKVIREMYPQARVLVAGEADLSANNRQLFIARARAGNYDFVVMTQQQFERIMLSKAFCEKFYNQRIDDLVDAARGIDSNFDPDNKPDKKLHPTIKLILRQVATLRRKLKDIAKTKDLGLTFEQSGCDLVVYDEYDEVKNLGYVTKMERVVGLGSRTGCARAFDFEMKRLFIQQTHGNNRLIPMTGTFISNTMAEFWKTLMDLARDQMVEYGWDMFDAWAAQNGAVITQPEVKHTGVIKMVSRFARFVNMPEQKTLLASVSIIKKATDPDVDIDSPQPKYVTITASMSPFQREFADHLVHRAELCERDQSIKWCNLYWYDLRQLQEVRDSHPDPEISVYYPEDGWSHEVATVSGEPMAEIDQQYFKLLDYKAGPRKGRAIKRVDPREFVNAHGQEIADQYLRYGPITELDEDEGDEDEEVAPAKYTYHMTQDNMLSISTAGRKMAIDQRLVHWEVQDDPTDQARWARHDNFESKLHLCINKAYGIYRHTRKHRATQIIFCDLSTPNGRNFSAYAALRQGLIDKGMSASQIAFIHDYDTDDKRAFLYKAMNEGRIAVLIASSATAGVGVNIQKRLVALHHFDCPWRPRELTQRMGRILRSGNMFSKVLIYTYLTQGYAGNSGYDAFLWQVVQVKGEFIAEACSNDLTVRHYEEDASDSPVFSAAELKALATGDMRMIYYVKAEAELRKLDGLVQGCSSDINRITGATGSRSLKEITSRIGNLTQTIEQMEPMMPLLYEQADICTNDAFTITIGKEDFTTKTAAGRAIWELIDQVAANHEAYANRYLNLGRYGGLDMKIYVKRSAVWTTETKDNPSVLSTEIIPYLYLTTDWEKIEVRVVKDHHATGQRIESAYLKIFDDLVSLKSRRAKSVQDLEKTQAALIKRQDEFVTLKNQREILRVQKLDLEQQLGINQVEPAIAA